MEPEDLLWQGHVTLHHTLRLSGGLTRLCKLCKQVPFLHIVLIWCQRLYRLGIPGTAIRSCTFMKCQSNKAACFFLSFLFSFSLLLFYYHTLLLHLNISLGNVVPKWWFIFDQGEFIFSNLKANTHMYVCMYVWTHTTATALLYFRHFSYLSWLTWHMNDLWQNERRLAHLSSTFALPALEEFASSSSFSSQSAGNYRQNMKRSKS